MTTTQTDVNPTPERRKSGPSYFDRGLTIANFVLLLANSVGAVYLFGIYGSYELKYKRAALETQSKPHTKHSIETRVTMVKAPESASPGVFSVYFSAKITNNGTFPFTLGKDNMTLALGTYDPAAIKSTTPIVVNGPGPGSSGPITWGTARDVEVVGRAKSSIVFPGGDDLAETSFLVAGPSHAFIHVRYFVPMAMDGIDKGPLEHSHVVHLLEIVKAEDKAGKAK
jgi:hypothetical protein